MSTDQRIPIVYVREPERLDAATRTAIAGGATRAGWEEWFTASSIPDDDEDYNAVIEIGLTDSELASPPSYLVPSLLVAEPNEFQEYAVVNPSYGQRVDVDLDGLGDAVLGFLNGIDPWNSLRASIDKAEQLQRDTQPSTNFARSSSPFRHRATP